MAQPPSLQDVLKALIGSNNVYFEPPSDIEMSYPCIVYGLDDYKTMFADNKPHRVDKRYSVTVIDYDAGSEISDKVILLPKCTFGRKYVADNLHHFNFTLFF